MRFFSPEVKVGDEKRILKSPFRHFFLTNIYVQNECIQVQYHQLFIFNTYPFLMTASITIDASDFNARRKYVICTFNAREFE